MTNDGPSDGRFVGPSEVRRVVMRLLDRFGGRLTEPARGICRLTGSQDLAKALLAWAPRAAGGSRWTTGQLAAQLRDGTPVRVTFDNDVASKMEVELISSRHPLVRVALDVLDESDLSLCRFGVVGLPGLEGSPDGCLARVDLAQSGGVRPRLEMWVTGLDLATGQEVDLGGALLDALAHGRLVDVHHQPHPDLDRLLGVLDEKLAVRRRDVEAQRRADNDALVDARIASQVRSIDLKLQRARSTLQQVIDRQRDSRVVRLHEGRIRNLLLDRDAVSATMQERRALDVSTQTVAVLQVHPV